MIINVNERVPCARPCSNHLTCFNSFSHHENHMKSYHYYSHFTNEEINRTRDDKLVIFGDKI